MANLKLPLITTAWTNSDGTPTLVYWQFMQNLLSQSGAASNVVPITGADPLGVVDSTEVIQSTISANPGKTWFLPRGNYKISSALVIGNGTSSSVSTIGGGVLLGEGIPGTTAVPYTIPATTLTWAGPTNDVMVQIAGPLVGWGVQNLCLEALSTAGVTCLNVLSGQQGDCRNLVFSRCFQGLASQSYDVAGGLTSALNVDCIHNSYVNISVLLQDQAGGPKAFLLANSGNSTVTSDTDCCEFINIRVSYLGTSNRMYAFYMQVCDSNVVQGLHVDGGNTNLTAINFDYTIQNNFPSSNKFFAVDPGGANRLSVSGSAGIGDNAIYGLITTNGGNVQALSGVTFV